MDYKKIDTKAAVAGLLVKAKNDPSFALKMIADLDGVIDDLNLKINPEDEAYKELALKIYHFKSRVEKGDAESLTLLAIAYESGFNSKATFNRIFKQQEGITPFQFKKNIEKRNNASSISKTDG